MDTDFNLEKLFLPAWAQESASVNRYADHNGEDDSRGGRRGPGRGPDRGPNRGPRRDGPGGGGGFRSGPRQGPGGASSQGGPRQGSDRGPRGDRGPQRGGGGPRFDRRPDRDNRPVEAPLPEILVSIVVDEKGADLLARQIRMTGRAYPMFDIGQMILQKPERHQFVFQVEKKPDGTPVQPLVLCVLDDTLWLSENEAVEYVLDRHFNTFYQAERTATEPPKGVYTFVAQCGMSGIILGPPNYHDYQIRLHRLHTERFSRMPFEVFKSRVKIVRDEAVVKKWVEDQSWRTEYICLNVADAPKLPNREAVEKHFRETHMANIIQVIESKTLTGVAARQLRSHGLSRLVRSAWEDQKRFPLRLVAGLSTQFAARGLQFFKRDKTVTHVAVARPHFLDLELAPVSDGIKRIIDFVNATPKCTRPALLKALAPTPTPVAPPPPPPPVEGAPAAAAQPAPPVELTPEQAVVISDLHWLVHQGHVIEFANGTIETAKRPLPKPVKPEPKPVEAKAAPAAPAAAPAEPPVPVAEAALAPVTEPAPVPAPVQPVAETPAPSPEAAAATQDNPSPSC